MISDSYFDIPRLNSIPSKFFEIQEYKEVFEFLGFKQSASVYHKIFSNSIDSIELSVTFNGFQWIIHFPCINNIRTVISPYEISIQDNLAPIEIIAIIYFELKKFFKDDNIPSALYYGQLYSEYIKSLKLSRPQKPYITVERDVLRFTFNKIKKQFIDFEKNHIIKIFVKNDLLTIEIKDKYFYIPVLQCDNYNTEIITVLFGDFISMFPTRFNNETVGFSMLKSGLLIDNYIIRANWDGADIWAFDEYDTFLSNRLIKREILF